MFTRRACGHPPRRGLCPPVMGVVRAECVSDAFMADGIERTLAPGVNVALDVVRMAVNEQFPSLMPTLYPCSMTTDPKPYASLDKMWKAFGDLANDKTRAVNGDNFFSLPVSS